MNQIEWNHVYDRYMTPIEKVSRWVKRIFRRQDAPRVYDVNSSIYFYDTEWLLRDTKNSPMTDKTEIYLMPAWAFCDIDNDVDFAVSEFLHRRYYLKGNNNV